MEEYEFKDFRVILSGDEQAAIAKVDGVAVVSIAKINGVAV